MVDTSRFMSKNGKIRVVPNKEILDKVGKWFADRIETKIIAELNKSEKFNSLFANSIDYQQSFVQAMIRERKINTESVKKEDIVYNNEEIIDYNWIFIDYSRSMDEIISINNNQTRKIETPTFCCRPYLPSASRSPSKLSSSSVSYIFFAAVS